MLVADGSRAPGARHRFPLPIPLGVLLRRGNPRARSRTGGCPVGQLAKRHSFAQPGWSAGSLPYELRSPIVPSSLWITCSVLRRRASERPASTASALVSYVPSKVRRPRSSYSSFHRYEPCGRNLPPYLPPSATIKLRYPLAEPVNLQCSARSRTRRPSRHRGGGLSLEGRERFLYARATFPSCRAAQTRAASQTRTPTTDMIAPAQITAFMRSPYPLAGAAKNGLTWLEPLFGAPRDFLEERGAELEQLVGTVLEHRKIACRSFSSSATMRAPRSRVRCKWSAYGSSSAARSRSTSSTTAVSRTGIPASHWCAPPRVEVCSRGERRVERGYTGPSVTQRLHTGNDVSEKDLQRGIIDLACALGYRVAHFRPVQTSTAWRTPVAADGAGWPDLVLISGRRPRGCVGRPLPCASRPPPGRPSRATPALAQGVPGSPQPTFREE